MTQRFASNPTAKLSQSPSTGINHQTAFPPAAP